jgi:hypothetical protein
MRVNVYAEEMTNRIEVIEKETKDGKFTGVRFYLYLPVTLGVGRVTEQVGPTVMLDPRSNEDTQVRGPFLHNLGDDDSSAVTFWGKQGLRAALRKALEKLDAHYAEKTEPAQ